MMIATDLVNKYVRRYSQMPFVSPPNELYQRHRVSKSDSWLVWPVDNAL